MDIKAAMIGIALDGKLVRPELWGGSGKTLKIFDNELKKVTPARGPNAWLAEQWEPSIPELLGEWEEVTTDQLLKEALDAESENKHKDIL